MTVAERIAQIESQAAPRYALSYLRWSSAEQTAGDSYRRQEALVKDYVTRHGLTLLETRIDSGKSAFSGAHRKGGKLGALLEDVKAGKIPAGTILLVEAVDRLTREPWQSAYPEIFLPLLKAGLSICFLQFGEYTIRPGARFQDTIQLGFAIDLANDESRKKSKRLQQVWEEKKAATAGDKLLTKKLPGWLKYVDVPARAEGGKWFVAGRDTIRYVKLQPVPERVEAIRLMFSWADKGSGDTRILQLLGEHRIAPWGKGLWTRDYVRALLTDRRLLGEYQPSVKRKIETGGNRKKSGEPIAGYFPPVIDPALFARVNKARRTLQSHKFRGKGGAEDKTRNLFAGLVEDVDNRAPMSYKGASGNRSHARLITQYRHGLTQHTIRYDAFEELLLDTLFDEDWRAVGKAATDNSTPALVAAIKALDSARRQREKWEGSIMVDPLLQISQSAVEVYRKLVNAEQSAQRHVEALETAKTTAKEIATTLITSLKQRLHLRGTPEGRRKLRAWIAARVREIAVSFAGEFWETDPAEEDGSQDLVARLRLSVTYVNAASRNIYLGIGKKGLILSSVAGKLVAPKHA
jgi:DNA invertase Pin-like site-specific DNA recombinase